MSFLTSIRYFLEYAAARSALALADLIPVKSGPMLASFFGDLVFYGNPKRRKVAEKNLLSTGVAANARDAARLARASFRHFALLTIESIRAQRILTPANLERHITLHIPDDTLALMTNPRQGILAACGHFGNWEIMARVFSFTKPVVAIAQPMKNPLVDRLMAVRSPDSRYRTIPKHDDDMMRLLAALKDGCALGVMIDQYALKKPIVVDFLGQPACSHRSIAMLHLVTRTPIVYCSCRRTGLMRFEITLSNPLAFKPSGDKERDIHAIIQNLNERLERDIRSAPEQYMWGHRRWRPPKP
jgi:KDO2-lipid IV(A) lauroyltransferase